MATHRLSSVCVKKSELLRAFDECDELYKLRDTSTLTEILERLPADPAAYVEAARDALAGVTLEAYGRWTEECNLYQRFEDILRELFYADERTLEALVWIVEWSATTPGLAGFGINPLAILASKLERRPLPRIVEREFLANLELWAQMGPTLGVKSQRHGIAESDSSTHSATGRGRRLALV